MATKKKAAAAPVATGVKVTITDLSAQYAVEPKELRAFIRAQGFRAPEVKQEGFGPRAKYEWDSADADLAKIRTAIEAKLAAAAE